MTLKSILVALALLVGAASGASAATGAVATGNVNLRAGPSTAYPVVTTVPAGAGIVTHGCLAGYTWCDIGFAGYRGWVSARYIQIVYQGAPVVLSPVVAPRIGIVVVGFNQAYWNTYYAAYPWYYRGPAYYGSGTVTGPNGGTVSGTRTCGPHGCSSTVTGPNGGTASGAHGCGPRGCAGAGTITGPNGGTIQHAGACGPRGCVGGYRAVGPNGGTRSGAGHFRW